MVILCLAVIFMLMLTGKQTVSKMNAFDFLITVALGSTLATVANNSKSNPAGLYRSGNKKSDEGRADNNGRVATGGKAKTVL